MRLRPRHCLTRAIIERQGHHSRALITQPEKFNSTGGFPNGTLVIKIQVAPRGPLCWPFHAEQLAVMQVAE
ncbi:MAG: hypothetical protein DMG75_10145 [Acidobacteria bacterium]|nr:MAG: hypothetical protein DMG75_10145 [Acidobacteriota bacterium]